MRALQTADIPDLIATTLPHFKDRGNFQSVFALQSYYFLQEVFTKDKMTIQDGQSIQFTVVLDHNGTARHTGLYATREYNQRDAVKIGTQKWCYADAAAMYEAHELAMNKGASQIAKYIKIKYFMAYRSLAELLEQRAVLAPDSPSDTDNPNGLSWWLSPTSAGVTDYEGAFQGSTSRYGDGSTSSVIGGIDAAVNPMWQNWAANRQGDVDMRLCESMRKAMVYCNFVQPTSIKHVEQGPAAKWRILTSLQDQIDYETLVNSGGDDRNGDLSPFKGILTYRGVRWQGVPTLDDDALRSIYLVNFGHFYPVVMNGWWLREDEALRDVKQRHVYVQGIDCQYNYMADNRRKLGARWTLPIAA